MGVAETVGECPELRECIETCDQILDTKEEYIGKLEKANEECLEASVQYNKMLDEKNAQLESPLRNPWIVGPVAVVIGVLIGGLVIR